MNRHIAFLLVVFPILFLSSCATGPDAECPCNQQLYPDQTWLMHARPEEAGFSYEKLALARQYSEEVGSAKPSPEIFDTAFARMGHPARGEVLIVGDSLTSDIQGGHDYGIDTCWFNPGGMAHDGVPSTFEIRRLAELIQIVQDV